jgi:hypothetical protein
VGLPMGSGGGGLPRLPPPPPPRPCAASVGVALAAPRLRSTGDELWNTTRSPYPPPLIKVVTCLHFGSKTREE